MTLLSPQPLGACVRRRRPGATLLGLALALAGLAPGAARAAGEAAADLTFTSWGGNFAQAQMSTVVQPYMAKTGLKVQMAEYAGGLAQLRQQRAAGRAEWDVVDLTMTDALAACKEGLLERLDPAQLAPGLGGEKPQDDYMPGGLTDCLAGTIVWSTVMVYKRQARTERDPNSIADLFDVQRFPGKRGLLRSPEGNLEWALLADGVPVDKVYAVLSTPEGVNRALRKLDTLRPHIRWWDTPMTPLQWLADGEVVMASTYNGRAYGAMLKGARSLRFMWDGQLLNIAGLGIVKGTRRPDVARDFVRFATRPDVMAAMAPLMAYGPTRTSASTLIDPVLAHLLPSAPWYRKRSIQVDAAWWAQHGDALRQRFEAWLAR
ncbi:ABC transporter substrate-binding protein [Ideonella livida]|uniref:ABC transporter substrate-binding protein n=1 Tax=Ideonella livida TaxID=2707176 RepID=A0A7C9PJ14_9BURK|nr:ABC transporter substrate-binding protein [Ideonella livida]NDY93233.1 ABC transporter substrate-binding protein [Ideonella livida]